MGRRDEPVVPGVNDVPGWKVRTGVASARKERSDDVEWEPDVTVEADADEVEEAEVEAGDALFAEEELQRWSSREAVLWIMNAANAFEVLSLRPKPVANRAALRRRYHRLSLLTHPDKSQDPQAGAAFQRLNHAMQILSDDQRQQHLLGVLFPNEHGLSVGEQLAAAVEATGMYDSPAAARAAAERATQAQLENTLKQALHECQEMEEADRAASERFRKRGALAVLTPEAVRQAGAAKRQRHVVVAGQDGDGSQSKWGLPEAFRPPAVPGASALGVTPAVAGAAAAGGVAHAAATADPNMIWELTGASGLAANGWQRVESRNHPGRFYFLHKETGRTVLPSTGQLGPAVAPGWERRESRTRPGVFYYANVTTGQTRTDPPRPPTLAAAPSAPDAAFVEASKGTDTTAAASQPAPAFPGVAPTWCGVALAWPLAGATGSPSGAPAQQTGPAGRPAWPWEVARGTAAVG